MSPMTLSLLYEATLQTLAMVIVSGFFTLVFGLPLGVLMYIAREKQLLNQPMLGRVLSLIVNITRSIPFVILMVIIIPFTRLLAGTSIGTVAAMVPLTLCAIPFFARVTENALLEINPGLIETAHAMGATLPQIIRKILLPEALPNLINGFTLTLINLTGYSAMAGAIGGGGLGDLAIRYGYQRFEITILFFAMAIMVILVQFIQFAGDFAAKWFAYPEN
ncbi:MAG: methionine ABC transporter permease [Gammaproteobacteria bacterium]|nr:methionine ABC transporter permease [Gammaproteobacteria bacterium]